MGTDEVQIIRRIHVGINPASILHEKNRLMCHSGLLAWRPYESVLSPKLPKHTPPNRLEVCVLVSAADMHSVWPCLVPCRNFFGTL